LIRSKRPEQLGHKSLRIVFMGTPDFAVPALRALADAGHEILAVYTQPPRPAGRGLAERKSPVHLCAESMSIPVRTPRSLRDADAQAVFAALKPDLAVVAAYGLILPQEILDAPRLGCWNIHASLLPRWRGAAPIQRAILAGDKTTGISIMKMAAGLDTGPVAAMAEIGVGADETAGELHDRLAELGARMIVDAVAALENGTIELRQQEDATATYAKKIDKAEAQIDWRRGAADIHNQIRALSPFPGAWCEMPVGSGRERVKILGASLAEGHGDPGTVLDNGLTVACGTGAARLTRLQRAGRQPQAADDFLRGARIEVGARLS
jgi:methionyl-tRNA formyltransferase